MTRLTWLVERFVGQLHRYGGRLAALESTEKDDLKGCWWRFAIATPPALLFSILPGGRALAPRFLQATGGLAFNRVGGGEPANPKIL